MLRLLRMQRRRSCFTLLLVALSACGSGVAPCPVGSVVEPVSGVCVLELVDGGLPDAGLPGDAGAPREAGAPDEGFELDQAAGGVDAGELADAGVHCAASCGGETPVCDPSTRACVACLEDAGCPGVGARCADDRTCVECLAHSDCPAGVCELASRSCVECLSNSHCGHLTASRCEAVTHTCGPCETAADCGHIRGRPACVAGACERCHPTLGNDCGIYSCSQRTLTCTTRLRGYSDIYDECEASSECNLGPCVRQAFVGVDRYVCTWWSGGACNAVLPVRQIRPSIHGETVEVCMLREDWLTYEAAQLFMHYYRDSLATPDVAGYRCTTNSDCPFGTFCRDMHFRLQPTNTQHCAVVGCSADIECPGGLKCRPAAPGQPNYCAVWQM